MISPTQFLALGQGTKDEIAFDLSLIPSHAFTPFLNGFQKHGKLILKNVAFTASALSSINENSENTAEIQQSIVSNIENYDEKLVDSIVCVLRENNNIRSIGFEHLQISATNCIRIAQAVSQSRVTKFVFYDIQLQSATFQKMLSLLEDHRMKSLTFRKCSLHDGVISYLTNYIKETRKKYPTNLRKIDVSENLFSDRSYTAIEDALKAKYAKRPKEDVIQEIRELRAENKKIRVQIERLKEIRKEVKRSDALFIVGDGAVDLINKMRDIEERIDSLENP